MRELLESISLSRGALLIAALSVGIAFLTSRLPIYLRWLIVVIVPFILAYCLYWSPVWLGSDDVSQYSGWAVLAVGTWFLAGAIPSTVTLLILQKRHAK
jgi:hypothetical protein